MFGQTITVSAAVTALSPASGTPTGTLTFYADGSAVGSVAVDNSGHASVSVGGLSMGTHGITADYSGDGNFNVSSGATSETVIAGDTTTSVSTSANPSPYGQTITVSATITVVAPASGTPTGAVAFYADGVAIGSEPINSFGYASIQLNSLSAGTHTLTANYAGDVHFNASSGSITQTVNKATPTVTVSDAGGIYNGTAYPASATAVGVDGMTAVAGTFTFTYTDGSGNSSTTAPTDVGGYAVFAVFTSGNPNYANGSASTTFTIAPATPTVVVYDVSATYDGLAHGTTGEVYGIGGIDLGSATISYSSGSAPVDAGSYTATGSFAGDSNYSSAIGSPSARPLPWSSSTTSRRPTTARRTAPPARPTGAHDMVRNQPARR